MNTVDQRIPSHSADVQMHLSVNGHTMSIGHLGPDYVVLDTPIDHPPSDAEISLSVDGNESRWKVRPDRRLVGLPGPIPYFHCRVIPVWTRAIIAARSARGEKR